MFTTTAANLAAQRQAALFEESPDDFALTPAIAPHWHGHPGPLGRNRRWTHPDLPGITVHHCGHPTALRPYYVTGHSGLEGQTFQNLVSAQEAAATPNRKDQP
jgi:hypothetical protein